MEELLELLKEIKTNVDYENCTDLVDGGVLDSFDILRIISALDEQFDLSIPAGEITPTNFNSAKALYEMIQRLQEI